VLRFQIINGSLWIDHLSERHAGWYPARLGPGASTNIALLLDHQLHHKHQSFGLAMKPHMSMMEKQAIE